MTRSARIGLWILALVILFPVTIVGGLVIAVKFEAPKQYDRSNPDYKYIVDHMPQKQERRVLDLSRINGGDWQFLCVIGPYRDAEEVLRSEASRRRLQIRIIDPVRQRWLSDPVEQSEAAISYVDRSGRGRTLMLAGGFGWVQCEHSAGRYGRDEASIDLRHPANNASLYRL